MPLTMAESEEVALEARAAGPWPRAYDRYFKPRGERPDLGTQPVFPLADAPPALSSTFEVCSDPLTPAMARHLLRRTGIGVSAKRMNEIVGRPADEVVDEIVDAAIALDAPAPPAWANAFPPPEGSADEVFDQYFQNNVDWGFEYTTSWMQRLAAGGLREKLAMFWHNHFVTEIDVYFFAPMAYRYASLMRQHALGNFEDFVHAVGLDPAMLVYLDGRSNIREEPNENYARELLELFTMGHFDQDGAENYTQEDIVELSRALTGWYVDYSDFSTNFGIWRHDAARKTFLGKEDWYTYDKSISHIFEARAPQIAQFISRKLYHFFVQDADDPSITDPMAALFEQEGFEIAPALRRLLKSKRFFDSAIFGVKLKGPLELVLGMMHESGRDDFTYDSYWNVLWRANDLGQRLLQPPNVAGWPGYRNWITTSTLPSRWEILASAVENELLGHIVSFVPAAAEMGDAEDPMLAFWMATHMAEHLLAVPLDQVGYEPPEGGFAGDLVSNPIPQSILDAPAYVRHLAIIFLAGTPWYEWNLYMGGSGFKLKNYVRFLMELPEYQLA